MNIIKFFLCLNFLLSCESKVISQVKHSEVIDFDCVFKESSHWVDSVYNSLNRNERIAQLFWIAVEIPHVPSRYSRLKDDVDKLQPGGIILYAMKSEKAREVVADLQTISKVPLFVSVDGEVGAGMRLSDMGRFPYAITLGAVEDDRLIYRLGLEMAREFRSIGINVNLAPVMDVNNHLLDPAIGHRAFGDDPDNVKRKSIALMQGLQEGGIMAIGKHFPGHGNTNVDSHHKLPVNHYPLDSLKKMDLVPFHGFISAGGMGLMSAHIEVPVLEKGVPASFSSVALKTLLRKQMKFKGLLVVDAINMAGAAGMGSVGEIDVKALIAGNDIIVMPRDLAKSIEAVGLAIDEGILNPKDIEEKCRRSLAFKYWLTVRKKTSNNVNGLVSNSQRGIIHESSDLKQELYESALTILKGKGFEDLRNTMPGEYACVAVGNTDIITKELTSRFGIPVYQIPLTNNFLFQEVLNSINQYEKYIVIIGIPNWGKSDANSTIKNQISLLTNKQGSVVVFMGNPYHLPNWQQLMDFETFVMAYENTPEAQTAVVKLFLKKIQAKGKFPSKI